MKISTALIAMVVSLFSTSIVSGEWLPVLPEDNYYHRCMPEGLQVNTLHACFRAHPKILKRLMDETNFKGYLAPDAFHFVLLPPDDVADPSIGSVADPSIGSDGDEAVGLNTALVLDDYTVDVSFYIDDTQAPPQDKCALVTIYRRPSKVLKTVTMCGTDYMDLPRYLWK